MMLNTPAPPAGAVRPASHAALCFVLGGLLVISGLLAHVIRFTVDGTGATLSQWNGLCTSGLGQLGQLLDSRASAACQRISLAEHAAGWGTVAGAGLCAVAIVLVVRRR